MPSEYSLCAPCSRGDAGGARARQQRGGRTAAWRACVRDGSVRQGNRKRGRHRAVQHPCGDGVIGRAGAGARLRGARLEVLGLEKSVGLILDGRHLGARLRNASHDGVPPSPPFSCTVRSALCRGGLLPPCLVDKIVLLKDWCNGNGVSCGRVSGQLMRAAASLSPNQVATFTACARAHIEIYGNAVRMRARGCRGISILQLSAYHASSRRVSTRYVMRAPPSAWCAASLLVAVGARCVEPPPPPSLPSVWTV